MATLVQSFDVHASPFIGKLDNPLTSTPEGSPLIKIKGELAETDERFDVNFQEGPTPSDAESAGENIGLHISVRAINETVVLNSLDDEGWGEEDEHVNFPLTPGEPFEIEVVCEANAYQIYFNEQHFATFQYRRPVDQVTHINITEGVKITEVQRHTSRPAQH